MLDPLLAEQIFTYDEDGMADYDGTMAALQAYLTLNIYRVTNRNLIVQTFPSSGDCSNTRHNIDQGAYEVMAITLPKAKTLAM